MLTRGTSTVVAGEDGVEADYAVRVRLLDAPQVRGSQAALAPGADAAVRARRVAAPGVDQEALGRLARLDVDELDLEVQRHAHRVLDDVAADVLLVHEVRPVGVVGRQHAAGVGPEDIAVRRLLVEVM